MTERVAKLEWWRLALIGLLTVMVATVAYGTLQTNRLVQQEERDERRSQAVIAEAFARLQRIETVVAEEFQDHRKRGESGQICIVEIMATLHESPPIPPDVLLAGYTDCVNRISGGALPPEGVESMQGGE